LLVLPKYPLQILVEMILDEARGAIVRLLEASAVFGHLVTQRAKLGGDLVERTGALVNATKLRFEFGAERADEHFATGRAGLVKHVVGRVEHGPEEVELLAEDFKCEPLRFVILCNEVDDGHPITLAVAVAAADALLDALRVPRQIVVHDGVAELQVQALGARLGRDEYALGTRLEFVHEREPSRDLDTWSEPLILRDLLAPALERLCGALGVVVASKDRDFRVGHQAAFAKTGAQIVLGDERLGEDDDLCGPLAPLGTLCHKMQCLKERSKLAVLTLERLRALDEAFDPLQLLSHRIRIDRTRARARVTRPWRPGFFSNLQVLTLQVGNEDAKLLDSRALCVVAGDHAAKARRHALKTRRQRPSGGCHPTVKPEKQQLAVAPLEGQDAGLEEIAGDLVVECPL
jgi:hypothetical protein